jgi:hypothetical protein
MLSARAERRHRDGQVPPRIAAVRSSKKTVRATMTVSGHEQEDISMDGSGNSNRGASPSDYAAIEPATAAVDNRGPSPMDHPLDYPTIGPATAAVNNARAAVLTEWRAHRERASVSDDEEDETTRDSGHEDSDEDLPGLIMPEDDEDSDNESVDDRIEAEWEKEWAELGVFY